MKCSLTTAGLGAISLALIVGAGVWYAADVDARLTCWRLSWNSSIPTEVAHQVRQALDRKVTYE